MKILVTGFEPFGQDGSNPSFDAVNRLPDRMDGAEIKKFCLPVSFKRSAAILEELLERETPDMVLAVGLAGGETKLCMERVGLNLMEARIPDNDGWQPFDTPLREDGENAYFATLPVKRLAEAVRKQGIPAQVSYSAGTFVCNAVLYHLLYLSNRKYPSMRCGFIHVPYDEALAAAQSGESVPYMALDDMHRALTEVLRVLLCEGMEADLKEAAGTLN